MVTARSHQRTRFPSWAPSALFTRPVHPLLADIFSNFDISGFRKDAIPLFSPICLEPINWPLDCQVRITSETSKTLPPTGLALSFSCRQLHTFATCRPRFWGIKLHLNSHVVLASMSIRYKLLISRPNRTMIPEQTKSFWSQQPASSDAYFEPQNWSVHILLQPPPEGSVCTNS